MMKIVVPIDVSNRTAKDGTAKKVLQQAMEKLRPEAAYFFPSPKGRTVLLFIDLKDPSDMPVIGEPFFQGLEATVTFTTVMNGPEFQAGLAKLVG